MQPQGVYNLQVHEEESRARRSRVGLLHQRTGVPVFLIYLEGIEKTQTFELFSMEDVETLRFKASPAFNRSAWQLVRSFFESEGQHAHVVASPFNPEEPLGSLIGEDRGLDRRSGLHCLKSYVEYADLVVVPQASVVLEEACHRAFYAKLFDLNTQLDHFFILVDFPKRAGLEQISAWRKGLHHANAALYVPWLLTDQDSTPPGPVAAAAYQKNDTQHGIQDSPANRKLCGPYRPMKRFSPSELALYNAAQLNAFHEFDSGDTRIWGGYTFTDSLDFDNKHIATRRTLLALREAIHQICEPFVLEPIAADLAHTIEVSIHSFFQDSKRLLDTSTRQAFRASVSIEERGGDDVVLVQLQLALPYVVNQMALTMALTG